MPIYEYRCAACGFQKEFLQKMSDAPLTVCPECGKPGFSKMVTAAGFQLKGSGWYASDFKHGTQPKSKSESKATDKPADKPADKLADKPADKPAQETQPKKPDAASSTATCGTGACPACS